MKTFNYHSVKDVKEASKLSSSKSAFLAGGMTTLPSMKLGLASYNDLINLKNIKNLSGIKVSGKTIKIGSAADYPSACIALNAVIHTNERKIEAVKFFKGMFETALKTGEIIEAVEFEIPKKSNYQKYPNPASRYAIVGVYVAECKSGVNVAVTGAKSCVYNDKNLSSALSKNFSSSALDGIEISSSGMNSDIHASAEYRANMVKVFTKKAVEAC